MSYGGLDHEFATEGYSPSSFPHMMVQEAGFERPRLDTHCPSFRLRVRRILPPKKKYRRTFFPRNRAFPRLAECIS